MAKKYSFKQFLTEEVELISNDGSVSRVKIDKISIPMIQRDYAQGRKYRNEKTGLSELNVAGKKFIKEIFSTLLSDSENDLLELDFIYGSIVKENGNGSGKICNLFSPLDGQQRLTTLFLLYWFVGGTELSQDEKQNLARVLENFVYMTRSSSKIFCNQLVAELNLNNIEFLLIQKATFEDGVEITPAIDITTQIKNLSWFHDSYKLDPTVLSMLNMLDEIQTLYIENKCQQVFSKLERLQFYILPLSNFELTEDLYVKMNARGKQLTDFENFKADLQDWLKKHAVELDLTEQQYDARTLPYDMFFINKMDNEWSQCFWKVQKDCDNKNKDCDNKNFDSLFLKFFYRYLLNEFVLNYSGNNRDMDKQANFVELTDESNYSGFSLFEKHFNKRILDNLVVLLDNVSAHFDDILDVCKSSWTNKTEKFNLLTKKSELELKERAVFCALVLYLVKKPFDKTALSNWMRVIWNIVENADIDSWRVTASVMQLILELSQYSDDIYAALADDSVAIKSEQAQSVVAEERQKAKLIIGNSQWSDALIQAEAHSFFKGSVGFLIPDDESLDGFKHNWEIAQIFFDSKGIAPKYQEDGHIFLRALLSRYSALTEIKYHIADTDEKEHSLKKMLASDPVVRSAIKEWFALPNESGVLAKLKQEVAKDSPIPVVDNDFDKKLHEALYKTTDLIVWMQKHKATRYQDNYISRPNSFYDWIYVRGYRNEIISELLQRDWQCKNECYIGDDTNKRPIPYFWSSAWREIDVTKTEEINGATFNLICSIGSDNIVLKVGNEKSDPINYHQSVTDESKVVAFVDDILTRLDKLKNL